MKTNVISIILVISITLLLAGCRPEARVGTLQSDSQTIELGDADSVSVEITFGAGNLEVSGDAEKLLEADFNYNVAELKPEVAFTGGKLVVRQPDANGLPDLRGITDFVNEWDLHLSDEVPMDLSLDVGGGTGNLQLGGLPLTGLDFSLGAGDYTVDLSGGWERDLDVAIDSGAADITVRLPKDVGARVKIDAGPTIVEATGLSKDGNIYTNAGYGVSDVTLQVNMQAGIGRISLEVE